MTRRATRDRALNRTRRAAASMIFVGCMVVVFLHATAEAASPVAADPDWPQETARRHLSERGRYGSREYIWYDETTDSLRPLKVRVPREATRSRRGDATASGVTPFSMLLHALAWLLVAVVFLAITYFALIYFIHRGKVKLRRKELGGTADDRRRIEALPLAGRRKDLPLLAAARKFYEEGNFAEAIIYLFSYQLTELDKHAMIHLAKGKTNRQYARELAARAALQSLYHETMAVFEDSYFGNHPPTRARFETCWTRLDQFERLLREATE